ncbi:retrovirus-related pol polyprotein from transposon TNT 1-94 [Tanacetum coccineum]
MLTINNGKVYTTTNSGETNFSFAAGYFKDLHSGAKWLEAFGKQRMVICYNYKEEGHMSRHCTKPKRKRDALWFKEKVLLVQAQAHDQIPNEEELAFLADPYIPEVIPDSEETLALAEESHSKMLSKHKDNMMLEKEKQVDTTPIDYVAFNKDSST